MIWKYVILKREESFLLKVEMTGNSASCGYVGRNVTILALTSYIWKVNYRISVIFECSANCHMWLLILIIGCLV